MKKYLSKLIKKKNSGQGELICSLFVMMALLAVLFLAVGTVKDISKVTFVDQVARQGIIRVETSGGLSSDERKSIEDKLKGEGLIFDSGHKVSVGGTSVGDGVYTAYKDGAGKWKIDTSNSKQFGYGDEAGIYIQCQAKTFSFGGNVFGTSGASGYTTIARLKTSITKTTK